jgi:hypothetical protein
VFFATWPVALTGWMPPGWIETWLTRPTCQSCVKIVPRFACTASVTLRQPSTCCGV